MYGVRTGCPACWRRLFVILPTVLLALDGVTRLSPAAGGAAASYMWPLVTRTTAEGASEPRGLETGIAGRGGVLLRSGDAALRPFLGTWQSNSAIRAPTPDKQDEVASDDGENA